MLKRVLFGLLFRKKGSEILRGDEVCGNLPEGADETFQIQKRRYQKGRGSNKKLGIQIIVTIFIGKF